MSPPVTRCSPVPPPTKPSLVTAITNTGPSGLYLAPKVPCAIINPNTLRIIVGTASDAPHHSSPACNILLSQLFTTTCHIMPHFHHNLMAIGLLCIHDYRVLFEKTAVTVFSNDNSFLLKGQRETTGSKL